MTTDIMTGTYRTECTAVDRDDLISEFVRVSADMAFWNEQYADAHQTWIDAKVTKDQQRVALYKESQDRLLLNAKGRVTIAEITAEVEGDPEYHEVVRLVSVAEDLKLRVSGTCEAIRCKKDMLISLGAHIRAELSGDPSIREAAGT